MTDARPVLLVEDDPDDQALALRALRKSAIHSEVVLAHDGEQALDYMFGTGAYAGRDTKLRPSLVLLDLRLPKVDGLEVLRRLRQDPRTRTQPVVVLTTSSDEADLRSSYRLNVNSFIRKPSGPVQFDDVVREIGDYWTRLNLPPPAPGA